MEIQALRLTPGQDLRGSLDAWVLDTRCSAAFILSAVGSLSTARLRYGGCRDAAQIDGDLELILLSGTLAPDGCHLHAAIADARGAVVGGHVLSGCIVRTTVELVIGTSRAHRFSRELDPATGFRELLVRRHARPG